MKLFFMTPLVIFLLMIMVMVAKLLDSDAQKPSALIGKPLPGFDLPVAIDGTPGLNNNDLKGQYTLLNVFASWCFTCKIEHQFLKDLGEKDIPIYGIAWKDKPEILQDWLIKSGNPYKRIGADKEGKAIIDLGVTGAPETFLVSPEGIVLYRHAGVLSKEIWENKIKPLMERK